MCFGVPMRITEVDGLAAICEAGERREEVTLALIGPVPVGRHVLVYLGSAIRTLSETEAEQISNAIEAVDAAATGRPFDHLLEDLIDREPELPEHLREDRP
ncbi:MAG: HypC/HybG/HupF family hydrogenase formation chaperone [Pseudomonadota bacterium]